MSVNRQCRKIAKTLSLETFKITDDAILPVDMKSEIKQIHEYIHEHTKISNEDKPLFMAIILIGLKNRLLVDTIDKVIDQDNVYALLETILTTYELNINLFKHLRHDKNKAHLYTLIKMVHTIYVQCPSVDLLNEFYSEFIKYGNTDSKSLGIVLTPPHIVELMVKMLKINKHDVVLDLCTGTGSFLLEAIKYSPKQIVGCEYQLKLFNLLKCNMIIRDIDNYEIVNDDCFNRDYVATKSLINPPYSTNDNEWQFIDKQLESLQDGGECCAIVPNSTVNDKSSNVTFKKAILNKAHVVSIILCRSTLFYPVANVGTVILHLRKGANPDYQTKIIDYRDDGFVSKRTKGYVKDATFDAKLGELHTQLDTAEGIKLSPEDTWYHVFVKVKNQITNSALTKSLMQLRYYESLLKLKTVESKPVESPALKQVSVDAYFNILTKPESKYADLGNPVFVIAAKNNSNGIKDIAEANASTFTGNKLTVVIGGDGGAGMCYYQSRDFKISSAVKVLSPRANIKLDEYIGIYIAEQLSQNKQIYNRGNAWKVELIKTTKFYLPFTDGKIDYAWILTQYP